MLNHKNMYAFSLIELVVVIIIIGMLSAVALPRYYNYAISARVKVVESNMSAFESAVTQAHTIWGVSGRGDKVLLVNNRAVVIYDYIMPLPSDSLGWPIASETAPLNCQTLWENLAGDFPVNWDSSGTADGVAAADCQYFFDGYNSLCGFSYDSDNGAVTELSSPLSIECS